MPLLKSCYNQPDGVYILVLGREHMCAYMCVYIYVNAYKYIYMCVCVYGCLIGFFDPGIIVLSENLIH